MSDTAPRDCIAHSERHPLTRGCLIECAQWLTRYAPELVEALIEHPFYRDAYRDRAATLQRVRERYGHLEGQEVEMRHIRTMHLADHGVLKISTKTPGLLALRDPRDPDGEGSLGCRTAIDAAFVGSLTPRPAT